MSQRLHFPYKRCTVWLLSPGGGTDFSYTTSVYISLYTREFFEAPVKPINKYNVHFIHRHKPYHRIRIHRAERPVWVVLQYQLQQNRTYNINLQFSSDERWDCIIGICIISIVGSIETAQGNNTKNWWDTQRRWNVRMWPQKKTFSGDFL